MVIERILKENRAPGAQLLGFGDGYVEIQNIKSVGGVAVAVASDEAGRSGKPDAWKRKPRPSKKKCIDATASKVRKANWCVPMVCVRPAIADRPRFAFRIT